MAITNGLKFFENGDTASADDVLSNASFMLSNMINFGLDGETTTSQNNLKLDLFGSNTAQYLTFMEYNSGTDLYECQDTSTTYYLFIEATSTTASSAGNVTIAQVSAGKWIVFASAGTLEVNRAEVMEWLWLPTNTADATTAKVMNNFVSITAIKSADSRDIGKRCTYVNGPGSSGYSSGQDYSGTKVGTLGGTSNNSSCWSACSSSSCGSSGTVGYSNIEFPTSSSVNVASCNGLTTPASSDEYGDDTSAEEANFVLNDTITINGRAKHLTYSCAKGGSTNAIFLVATTISWAAGTGSGNFSWSGEYDYDFFATGSIPLITAATESDLTCSITTDSTTITTNETVGIVKANYTLTAGNTIAYEISFDGGTNWLAVTEGVLAEVSNTGTSFRVRMTITRANDTEQDSITSYGAYYG